MKNNSSRLLLPAILVLAAFLRIYRLGSYDLWFDEVLCVFQKADLNNIINGKILDSNPPLYFLILHFFTPFKTSEFTLRIPSAIFGVLTVFAIYKFSKRFFNEKAALISSFLLAISPFHIYYSQEVKMYSMFILFSLLSLYFLTLAITETKESKNLWWAGFVITNALSLYTHYYGIMLILVETMIFLFYLIFNVLAKEITNKWLISNVIIFVIFLPWVPIMLREHLSKTSGFVTTWIPKPGLETFFYTFKNFSVGFSSPRWNYLLASLVFGLCFILGLIELYKRKEFFLIITSYFFIPPVILFLLSQYRPVYLDRYISFIIPIFCVILASGISRFKIFPISIFLILISAFSYFGYINLYETIPYLHQAPGEHVRIPIKSAVQFIEENLEQGDIIGHSCRSTLLSFEYYSRRKQDFLAVEDFEKYPQSSAWNHSSLLPELVPDSVMGAKRIWLVLSWWDPLPSLDPISQELKDWMDTHYKQVSYSKFQGIDLYLYEKLTK